ncbi:MAG: hypothetical protein AAFV53_27105 [Myxococcota bacterium]
MSTHESAGSGLNELARELLQKLDLSQRTNAQLRDILHAHGIADEQGRVFVDGEPHIIAPGERYTPGSALTGPILLFPTLGGMDPDRAPAREDQTEEAAGQPAGQPEGDPSEVGSPEGCAVVLTFAAVVSFLVWFGRWLLIVWGVL